MVVGQRLKDPDFNIIAALAEERTFQLISPVHPDQVFCDDHIIYDKFDAAPRRPFASIEPSRAIRAIEQDPVDVFDLLEGIFLVRICELSARHIDNIDQRMNTRLLPADQCPDIVRHFTQPRIVRHLIGVGRPGIAKPPDTAEGMAIQNKAARYTNLVTRIRIGCEEVAVNAGHADDGGHDIRFDLRHIIAAGL